MSGEDVILFVLCLGISWTVLDMFGWWKVKK